MGYMADVSHLHNSKMVNISGARAAFGEEICVSVTSVICVPKKSIFRGLQHTLEGGP